LSLGRIPKPAYPAGVGGVEHPGEVIDRYRLLEPIGEGGFGIAFRAEQVEPVQRQVALKVIKAGMDTKEVIARFEAERQALALMDHPNIARVLDGGATAAGRPYFVMELVRGIPITGFCDQNRLSTRKRLQLFIKICQAVQHAHQKGIIHRDIKPGNVLVTLQDGEPVPKVIDFGIAKALGQKLTEKTLFSGLQNLMGTPAYMSPEQAALSGLDIDTRADIYSLGVLLYELLTGETPIDAETVRKSALDEIRRMIQESEPLRPSTRLQALGEQLSVTAQRRGTESAVLGRLVRGDLDWIVMKCLEKDRQRRYETANGLAVDVARHLNSEPVVARPPSNLYRLQKTLRRHTLAFAAAGAVMASLVLGLSAATWLYFKTNAAEREQYRLWLQAERDKSKAQREEKKSKQVAYYLENTLGDIAPSLAKKCTKPYVQEVLARTDERIGAELREQPDVEAIVRKALAGVQIDIGEFAGAETNLTRVLEINRRLYGNQGPEVTITLARLVELLCAEGKRTQAEPLAKEAIGMLEHIPEARSENQGRNRGPDSPLPEQTSPLEGALKSLHATMQQSLSENMLGDITQARTSLLLAGMLERAGRLDAAAIEYRRALRIYEEEMARFPQNSTFGCRRDAIRGDLASVLNAQGKASEVKALLKQRPRGQEIRPTEESTARQPVIPPTSDQPAKTEPAVSATDLLGRTVPQTFALKLLSGGEIQLLAGTNHGPIVLDFFASWCGPCRLVTPVIAQIAREHADRGVRYLAVNCWGEAPEAVRNYLSRARLEIPVALDVKRAMSDAFKVDAVPKIVVLDGSNTIRYVHVGATPELADDLRRALDQLLSAQPARSQRRSP